MRSLDRETAERMLDGRVAPEDAPPGYGVVARVVAVLRASAPEEPGGRRSLVATAGVGAARATARNSRSGLPKRRVAALTAVMGGTVLFGLAGAGALPGPVQGVAASVLERVGVKVPDGEDATNDDGAVTPSVATPGAGKAGSVGEGASTSGSKSASTSASGSSESGETTNGEKNGNAGRNPNAATPAIPATPADPGTDGEAATPATPAEPAAPADPTHPTHPTQPTQPEQAKQPTQSSLPDNAKGPAS